MNVILIMVYSSTVMQGRRKLRECHTRFFQNIRNIIVEGETATIRARVFKTFQDG